MVDHGIVLGHVISSKGIEVDKANINTIHGLPPPTIVSEIHYFFGHTNFYMRFSMNFSKLAKPLCILHQKDTNSYLMKK